jgi:predicted lipid-binding transport protein (Tim44 family)
MKRKTILTFAAFAALTLSLNGIADAKRMGGGGNFGAQRSITPQKAAPAPAAPAGNAASQSTPPASQPAVPASASAPKAAPGAAPAAAPSGMSRWLGPIAGLAAGLGLAALMSHLGLSEGFGTILLLGLIVFAGIYLLRMFLARRQASSAPLQYAGAGANGNADVNAGAPSAFTSAPSAPSWRIPSTAELAGQPVSAPTTEALNFGAARKTLPQGFDAAAFAKEAKRQYIQVQRSYDEADRAALSAVMTADMAKEMGRELDNRGLHQPTEIVTLDADVLDVSTEDDQYWVSVRFTGLVKEDGEPLPHSIDEVWNLTKPVKGGSGWLLAGISQLA